MELADILKIVVPVILAMCATVAGTVAWIFRREEETKKAQDAATKEYWQTVHSSLEKMITELKTRLLQIGLENDQETARVHKRVGNLEKELAEFRVLVAGEYLKRDLWGENHNNLERKMDQLRSDMSKELKYISEQLTKWSKPS